MGRESAAVTKRSSIEAANGHREILKVQSPACRDTTPVSRHCKTAPSGCSAAVFHGGLPPPRWPNSHPPRSAEPIQAADAGSKADSPSRSKNFEAFGGPEWRAKSPSRTPKAVACTGPGKSRGLHELRSMLWVPMMNGGVTIGIICCHARRDRLVRRPARSVAATFLPIRPGLRSRTRAGSTKVRQRTDDSPRIAPAANATADVTQVISRVGSTCKPC